MAAPRKFGACLFPDRGHTSKQFQWSQAFTPLWAWCWRGISGFFMSDSSISWRIIKTIYPPYHCWSHPPIPKSLPLEMASQQCFKTCLSFRSPLWWLAQTCSLDTAGAFCRKELGCKCLARATVKQPPHVGANWGIGTARTMMPNRWLCTEDGSF